MMDETQRCITLPADHDGNVSVDSVGDISNGEETHLMGIGADKGSSASIDGSRSVNHCKSKKSLTATVIMFTLTAYLVSDNERIRFYLQRHPSYNSYNYSPQGSHHKKKKTYKHKTYPAFPAKALLGISINATSRNKVQNIETSAPYDPLNDFQYGRNRTLLYWEEVVSAIEQYQSLNASDVSVTNQNGTVWSNLSTWGACYPRALQNSRMLRSYSSQPRPVNRNWTNIVQANANLIADEESIVYPAYKKDYFNNEDELLEGHCRPGFLIIGQGKCGTSSLYHYLTAHPRVLPASEKQVHYFLYHTHQSLKWYYSHFPGIESFLGRGALMTGEASPGYMPYPSVLEMVVKRMSPSNPEEDGEKKGLEVWREHVASLPKIIAIVREPIDRAVSSYKYNYITPVLRLLRSGTAQSANGKTIPGRRSDLYYLKNHMFSLEELATAELKTLKQCLEPGGSGERYTRNRYAKFKDSFFYDSVRQRKGSSLPHLIHLDGACYEESSSKTVPRVQWKELGEQHPNKVLATLDLQLTQSIIGRGLYTFPLEWWYEVFGGSNLREKRIKVVCTEDMADEPVDTMVDITEFLGLPEFDSWSDVTSVGRYNVGGNRGYDTITHLDDGGGEESFDTYDVNESIEKVTSDLTALSDSMMNELMEFYGPYNERLFNLIGKRCQWNY